MGAKGRHFILKHEGCGGVFTVNSETFLDYVEKRAETARGKCPSCGQQTLSMDALKGLLETYCAKQKILADDGYSIREIKEPIEPENLFTIVNILKL